MVVREPHFSYLFYVARRHWRVVQQQQEGDGEGEGGSCDVASCLSARGGARAIVQLACMEYRVLGSSGMRVSTLGLGCFAFAGDNSTGSHLGQVGGGGGSTACCCIGVLV